MSAGQRVIWVSKLDAEEKALHRRAIKLAEELKHIDVRLRAIARLRESAVSPEELLAATKLREESKP